MGFRNGAYAKIWEVTPISDTATKLRLSISRKDKRTGEYEQDFSGFVLAIGTATAAKAAKLESGARIRIGDCDVTTKYDKVKKVEYVNYKLFSFEDPDSNDIPASTPNFYDGEPSPTIGDGEVDDDLPF